MPYFVSEDGQKGYVNDEGVMSRLEEEGYIRLKGKELFACILVSACKHWFIPSLVSCVLFYWTGEFMLSLIIFYFTHRLLD